MKNEFASEWLQMDDDELIHRIETLDTAHTLDEVLLDIVGSERHFFVRQSAAQKIRNTKMLHEHWDDRNIGQILVRGVSRMDDLAYLESLLQRSRYPEVRRVVQSQILAIRQKLGIETEL
ncbi:MAG: hypothetical protein JXO72_08675 [Vicinamibacteria bacterium]|nr:hypothetical protein [Vicinamibacteria bacterium]